MTTRYELTDAGREELRADTTEPCYHGPCAKCGGVHCGWETCPPAARPGGEGTPDDDLKMVMDACGFPRPAAVSAPASEPPDVEYARILDNAAPASGAPGEDIVRRVMAFLIDYGHHSAAEVSAGERGGNGDVKAAKREQRATRKAAEEYVRSIATRLAAAERAGVALREEIAGLERFALITRNGEADLYKRDNGDLLDRWAVERAIDKFAAALSPTSPAPSPEERADGE